MSWTFVNDFLSTVFFLPFKIRLQKSPFKGINDFKFYFETLRRIQIYIGRDLIKINFYRILTQILNNILYL